jgi:hypothetical protein
MRVLIDRLGLQAQRHIKDGTRLSTFITDLVSASHPTAFSSGQELTAEELGEFDILVITTRWRKPFSPGEIQAIRVFVRSGGGLLLLSNHADCDRNPNDTRRDDAELAGAFGVAIQRTFFVHELGPQYGLLSGAALNSEHPIIRGSTDGDRVRLVVTRTCSSLQAPAGHPLISLPKEMVDRRDNRHANGELFAIALDARSGLEPEDRGRVVIAADSGFIGTEGTIGPGPGLLGQGDNLQFVRNAIHWLNGEPGDA